MLENKVPTWDIPQKLLFAESGWCCMCKDSIEYVFHLFLECPFTKAVQREALHYLGHQVRWEGDSLEGDFLRWCSSGEPKALQALPPIISWGVWLARNLVTFNDQPQSLTVLEAKAIGIIVHFPQLKAIPSICLIRQEQINKEISWGYLDGAAQGNPTLCGGGVSLFFSDQNYITYKEGLGEGTNNFAELRALRL